MKKDERKALARAFAAPTPQRKQNFLRNLPYRQSVTCNLLWSQVRYISLWAWILSIVVFILILVIGQKGDTHSLWLISALTPLFAVSFVSGLAQSSVYGMAELEQATRFSLKTVLLGRMVLLGLANLLGLSVLLLWLPVSENAVYVGIHLLVPYLLSSLLSLVLIRRFRGLDGYAAALVAACFVGVCTRIVKAWIHVSVSCWLLITVGLFIRMIWECSNLLKKTEEYVWN